MEIKSKMFKIQWGEEKVLQIARELEALLNRKRPKVLYHNLAWDKFLKYDKLTFETEYHFSTKI